MDPKQLCFLTVRELSERIRKKEVSPVEVTQAYLDRIKAVDLQIRAYVTLTEEEALREAKEAERAILSRGYRGPFHGVPIAHKDLFCMRGVRTTGGSGIFRDYVSSYDAGVVERMREAGAISLGKVNTHEFGLGATTQNPHTGCTRNPWDTERIPGGSSGGSGAAVAAGLCAAATGNDGGGSIRIPSSLCGIVGLKPTFGRVSNYGGFPWVGLWSVCHSGPMVHSVEDAALMLQALVGYDPRDPASRDIPVPDYTADLNGGVKGLRLGVPRDYFYERLDPEVEGAVKAALQVLEGLGASLEEVAIPHIRYAYPALLAILSEASCAQDRLLRTRSLQELGPGVRTLAVLGFFVSAADYLKAQRVRRLLLQKLQEVFRKVDALVTPTLPLAAVKAGQATVTLGGVEEDFLDAIIRLTLPFNLTGSPALTVPCGFTASGLPIGLQVVGRAFEEARVLRIGRAYEAATPWHERRPAI